MRWTRMLFSPPRPDACKASAPRPDGSLGDLGAAMSAVKTSAPEGPMGLSGTLARPSRVGRQRAAPRLGPQTRWVSQGPQRGRAPSAIKTWSCG